MAFEVHVASREEALLEGLARALESPAYPLSLGPAFALAWAEEVFLGEGEVREGWEGEGVGWWWAHRLRLEAPPRGPGFTGTAFP